LGISNTPRIGRPGTPESERVHMNGGIWRYHPTRHVVEAVCQGTTNPWGLDWNPVGEPFFINTVIGHLWHAIPGAHFKLMYGDDTNPHIYGLIDQHADHYHFDTGQSWTNSRASMDGSAFASGSDSLGGGHAHTGLMIYQGDNWPEEYRGKLFMINFHGRRINVDHLKREGSGYVGQHGHDLLTIGDPWFRGIDLIEGPDGGVFISDWSDTGECHDNTGVYRSSGRIYKVTYGDPALPKFGDLTRLSDKELVPALFATDEWTARHARRELSDRAFETGKIPAITRQLENAFAKEKSAPQKLRALWALDALAATSNEWLLKQTHHADESIRSWAVRLLTERIADVTTVSSSKDQKILKSVPARFVELARKDSSALVRLYLASALQKLPFESRREVALALVHHPEDVGDHNLGLMIWFGIEPLVGAQPDSSIDLALTSEHRIVRQYIARRLAEDIETKPLGLEHLLAAAQQETAGKVFAKNSEDILRGMKETLHGWRKAKPPANWESFAKRASAIQDGEIQSNVQELSVLFGDPHALELVRQTLINTNAEPATRRDALRTLLEHNAANLAPSLKQLAHEKSLGADAIVALIELNDSEGADLAVKRYKTATDKNRTRLLAALVTRPAASTILLKAIGDGLISRSDLTPFYARQIASLNDVALTQRLGEVWGSVHSTDAEKRANIDRLRGELSEARLKSADLSHGRQVFNQTCAVCHKLYGEGGNVGPDLTGSGRANLDYLLENVIDPSALVPADYRMAIVNLKDDRVLNGVLRNQTARTVSIQSQTGLVTVERSEIESLQMSALSMMPEGLLQSLSADDRRDLIGFLMQPQQVSLSK
jgi:putative heme-binding domain-containing protein